jgi:hypothetical protein
MKAIFVVILLGCAAFAQNDAAIANAKAACGPDKIHFDVEASDFSDSIAQPASGKALVYVISNRNGITARIGLNGTWVGAINENSHIAFFVDPGEQHLCASWQSRNKNVALSSLTVEAGKVYYLRMRFSYDQNTPILDIETINSDEGKYLVLTTAISRSDQEK